LIGQQFVRQYASQCGVANDIADREVVLTYVLHFLTERGHGERIAFKGGTALRKLVFGPGGRFSVDLDFIALDQRMPRPEDALFDDLAKQSFEGINLRMENPDYTKEQNFRAEVAYEHPGGRGRVEMQLSHRHDLVIPAKARSQIRQPYFDRLGFEPKPIVSLDPVEMLAEKVLACHRAASTRGSARHIYDLYQFTEKGFDNRLLTSLTCLKAWTDKVDFSPGTFLVEDMDLSRYNWVTLQGLVDREKARDEAGICERVRERYNVLAKLGPLDERVLADTRLHRDKDGYDRLAKEVRAKAAALPD
jgi:predicted nucleotidyltransferase component of viral defense system